MYRGLLLNKTVDGNYDAEEVSCERGCTIDVRQCDTASCIAGVVVAVSCGPTGSDDGGCIWECTFDHGGFDAEGKVATRGERRVV